jgi:hypothetical protein
MEDTVPDGENLSRDFFVKEIPLTTQTTNYWPVAKLIEDYVSCVLTRRNTNFFWTDSEPTDANSSPLFRFLPK